MRPNTGRFEVELWSRFNASVIVYVAFSLEEAERHARDWTEYCEMADELKFHKSWNLAYPCY